MDIYKIFGLLTGVVIFVGYIPYIKDTLLRKTQPHRTSWLIWSILGGIAFFSQLSKGAGNSLWLPGVQTFAVLIVFGLSIKFGMGGLSKMDIFSLLVAGIGVVVWILTKEALFALLITVFVDLIGGFLSVVKSYKNPESETLITWILDGIAGLLAMVAVGKMDWILLIYPLYMFLVNLAVVMAIILGKNKAKT